MLNSSLIWTVLQVLISLVVVIICFFKWKFQYWIKRDVKTFSPIIPFGNLPRPYGNTVNMGIRMKDLYNTVRSKNLKYGGIYFFASPLMLIADLDLLKNILVKDFQYFTDRGSYCNEEVDPISGHLFAIGGAKWRNLRMKMTPTFTTGKMRAMFQTLVDCESGLTSTMLKYHNTKEAVNIKEILASFTTDVIGCCGFGLECKSFEDENSPFRTFGRKVFSDSSLLRLKVLFGFSFPKIGKALGMSPFAKDVSDFFIQIVKENVQYRERKNLSRNDFLQSMIELKNNKIDNSQGGHQTHDGTSLTVEEVAAQCFVFFVAGFETSSTTMTFALYELAKDQTMQQKVRNEVNEVLEKHKGKITYDSISEMKYMNQIIDETLRKYPPLPTITRETVKDYKVPGENLVIEKGVKILIPIYGIHHDPEYYENPEIFDPERFSDEEKRQRNPLAYIPFGEGPRMCIGLRFGIMQSKVGLASLLKNYEFTLNNKTREPLAMAKFAFILSAEGDIWLNTKKIDR